MCRTGRTLLWMLCVAFIVDQAKSTLVTTTTGPVSGKYNNVDGVKYISYEGIPYAEPPLGNLRFQDPVPVKPWKRLINATVLTPVCWQEKLVYDFDEMNEDCLFLNIYTPDISPTKLKPVIFFIHGGYLIWGSGNREPTYGPEKIISKDAILVTFNYRLGLFGFISVGSQIPGNAGLKDVLLALKWTSANIEKFGGDPNNIILAGEQAGSMLAQYLMLSEKSHGLYQKAILMSGSALNYRYLQRNPRKVVTELATRLGLKYKDDNDLVQQLKQTDPQTFVDVQLLMLDQSPDIAYVLNVQFVPCIEPKSSDAIVTSDPLEAMKAGQFVNVPIFTGFSNNEGVEIFPLINNEMVIKYPNRIKYLNENFDALIPYDINYPAKSQMRQDLANSIKQFYFRGGEINIFNVQNYINLVTDTAYAYSADQSIRLFKQKPNSKVYSVLLELDSDIYWFKSLFNITYPGAPDMNCLFFTQPVTKDEVAKLDSRKKAVLDQYINYLYNFITYGDPSPPGATNVAVQWKETGTEHGHLAVGDSAVFIHKPPFPERLNFWRSVYNQYYHYSNKY